MFFEAKLQALRRDQNSARVVVFSIAAIFALGAANPAAAGGYQLRQHGAGAQATAIAGATAGAHGLENLFFNPAVAGLSERPEAALSATLIAPASEITGAQGSISATNVGGSTRLDDAMPNPVVPAFYAAAPLDAEVAGGGVSLGFSASAPFGLETDYGRDWQGRYHAVGTEVVTFNLNPMLAYRASDTLTLGAGVQAQYFRGVLSNAVALSGGSDGFVEVDADDWAFGFNVGALWTPVAGTRLGLAYRSAVDHSLDGQADFSAGVPFADTGARADITTPRSVTLGISQALNDRWTLLGEAQWTDWSTFDQLVVAFDNPGQDPDVTRQDWHDGWFASVGARYRASDALSVSAGAAYDWSPVPDDTLTPRIPDADRAWLSLGLDWTPEDWLRLKLGYAHLFMPARTIELQQGDPGNDRRGDLTATTDTDVDIVSVTFALRF
ncbi:OmpP1/FadL family transporter [Rhodovibrio sodomensis]|uniref:OmpP1/FadL family transporter n=1 Tax=Rhodovibrio sodomensis TaxID=1088 RepID=UPI0019071CDA|nr:outer membrane protein transport protein [Rhodovibrio sodomensis]